MMHFSKFVRFFIFVLLILTNGYNFDNETFDRDAISIARGRVYHRDAQNEIHLVHFKEFVRNNHGVLELNENGNTRLLFHRPHWAMVYSYDRVSGLCHPIPANIDKIKLEIGEYVSVYRNGDIVSIGPYGFIHNLFEQTVSKSELVGSIKTRSKNVQVYEKLMPDLSYLRFYVPIEQESNIEPSTKTVLTFKHVDNDGNVRTQIELWSIDDEAAQSTSIFWQFPVQCVLHMEDESLTKQPKILKYQRFRSRFQLWTKESQKWRQFEAFGDIDDITENMLSLENLNTRQKTFFALTSSFLYEIDTSETKTGCKLKIASSFQQSEKIFKKEFAFLFEFQKLADYRFVGRSQVRGLNCDLFYRIERLNKDKLRDKAIFGWRICIQTVKFQHIEEMRILSIQELVFTEQQLFNNPYLDEEELKNVLISNVHFHKTIKLKVIDPEYRQGFDLSLCINKETDSFLLAIRLANYFRNKQTTLKQNEIENQFIQYMHKNTKYPTHWIQKVKLEQETNHIILSFKFLRLNGPEKIFQQVAGTDIYSLFNQESNLEQRFDSCASHAMKLRFNQKHLFMKRQSGGCQFYDDEEMEKLLSGQQVTKNEHFQMTNEDFLFRFVNPSASSFENLKYLSDQVLNSVKNLKIKLMEGQELQVEHGGSISGRMSISKTPFSVIFRQKDLPPAFVRYEMQNEPGQTLSNPSQCFRQCSVLSNLDTKNENLFSNFRCLSFSFCRSVNQETDIQRQPVYVCKFSDKLVEQVKFSENDISLQPVEDQHCETYQINPLEQFYSFPYSSIKIIDQSIVEQRLHSDFQPDIKNCAQNCLQRNSECRSFQVRSLNEEERSQNLALANLVSSVKCEYFLVHYFDLGHSPTDTIYTEKNSQMTIYSVNLFQDFRQVKFRLLKKAYLWTPNLVRRQGIIREDCATACYKYSGCSSFNFCAEQKVSSIEHGYCYLEMEEYGVPDQLNQASYQQHHCYSYERQKVFQFRFAKQIQLIEIAKFKQTKAKTTISNRKDLNDNFEPMITFLILAFVLISGIFFGLLLARRRSLTDRLGLKLPNLPLTKKVIFRASEQVLVTEDIQTA